MKGEAKIIAEGKGKINCEMSEGWAAELVTKTGTVGGSKCVRASENQKS